MEINVLHTDNALGTTPTFARNFHDALGFGRATHGFLISRDGQRPPRDGAPGWPAQALILAAGRGSRLGEGSKCLCEVGGRPLIEHQLEALASVGIESIGMVVGYERERVREVVGARASFIVNDRFADTNSLYSFMLAREWVKGDVAVLNCDVLFHPDMARMLQGRHRNALLFDSASGADPEEMKVAIEGGRLEEMSKDLAPARTRGENVGILRLDRHAARHAFGEAARIVARGGHRDWLASAINRTARSHPFKCVDVAGVPWTEIDFPDDLERARHRIWPAIRASRSRARRIGVGWPIRESAGRAPDLLLDGARA